MAQILDSISTFTTIFLGIFIEAVPYLLLGTLASGLVEVYLHPEDFLRAIPRRGWQAALAGSLLGLFFPVCECGVVPLTRRLFSKGIPLPMGIAFLLAAPVINPIVILSTLAAFGPSPLFWGRITLTLVIAVAVGTIFALQTRPEESIRPISLKLVSADQITYSSISPLRRFRRVLVIAADEFFEMGRYLVLGSLAAALLQTFIPQSILLSIGQGPLISVVVMVALAVLLSVCSTVDAFIALAFLGTFSNSSILAFLVYGPMVDIKSTMMFLQVFHRKTVVFIVLLPMIMTILAAVVLNVFSGY